MATPTAQQQRRLRPVPLRTCVGCRRERPKREMVRIVRTPAGAVQVDATGKSAGRGAYLCAQRSCWEQALKRGRLEAALHTTIEPTVHQMLSSHSQAYPIEET